MVPRPTFNEPSLKKFEQFVDCTALFKNLSSALTKACVKRQLFIPKQSNYLMTF